MFFNHKVHNGQHRVFKVVLIFIKTLVTAFHPYYYPSIPFGNPL